MSENKIIIDGIDVSGWTDEEVHYKFEKHSPKAIKQIAFDLYKQLKRKEQEYEDLRQYHNKCCEENEKKLEEWLEKYNQISINFHNGYYCNIERCSSLKAKEKELKNICKAFDIEYAIDEETGNLFGRCNKLYKKEQECEEMKKDIKDIANLLDLDTGEEYNFGNIELEIRQLKAKEQECERWKSNFNGKVSAIEELLKKLDQLKADREEALKQLEFVRTLNTVKEAENRKLSKTLTEIKEIAETENNDIKVLYNRRTHQIMKQILQKISEVE